MSLSFALFLFSVFSLFSRSIGLISCISRLALRASDVRRLKLRPFREMKGQTARLGQEMQSTHQLLFSFLLFLRLSVLHYTFFSFSSIHLHADSSFAIVSACNCPTSRLFSRPRLIPRLPPSSFAFCFPLQCTLGHMLPAFATGPVACSSEHRTMHRAVLGYSPGGWSWCCTLRSERSANSK